MSKIIFVRSLGFDRSKKIVRNREAAVADKKIFNMRKKVSVISTGTKSQGSIGIGFLGAVLCLFVLVAVCGSVYLYEVNDLATKGYEIREYENKLNELSKENKKMKIEEVQLRSMYNLEKSTEELDLVVSKSVTYIELASPVAMLP